MKEYLEKLKFFYVFRWRDLAFTVLLFTLILGIAFCRGQNLVNVTFGDTAVDVVGNRYSMNIPYDMVEGVELAVYGKDDDVISAREDLALRTGQWYSEVWGEYSACIDLQTKTCVLVHLNDGRCFAFSTTSDEVTQQTYETLLEKIQ